MQILLKTVKAMNDSQEQIREALIFCSKQPTPRQLQQVLEVLRKKHGENITLTWKEDRNIHSGFRILLDDDISDEAACVFEPMGAGVHGVEAAEVEGKTVLVSGCGPIGLTAIAAAKTFGAKFVIACDLIDEKLAVAKEMGADYVFNSGKDDLPAEVKKLTGGLGCTVYIEASGNPKSVAQGFECLANHGRFVQMGVMSALVETDFNTIGDGKELTIIGSHLSALVYPAVIRGIEKGLIRTDGLVTHTFPLSEFKKAYETAEKDPAALKVVLVPDA